MISEINSQTEELNCFNYMISLATAQNTINYHNQKIPTTNLLQKSVKQQVNVKAADV